MLEPVVDNINMFVASPNTAWWTSETIELKTTAAGLLSGASGTSEGNADEIFVSLANAVGALKGFGTKSLSHDKMMFLHDMSQHPGCNQKEGVIKFKIDLQDDNDLTKLAEKMKNLGSVSISLK